MTRRATLPAAAMQSGRRRWLGGLALAPLLAHLHARSQGRPACDQDADWTDFVARHIQRDGRVVDFDTTQQHSTSEGQSYSLFFALVHDDRPTFARVLAWTQSNLSNGSLATRLPAWQWGRRGDGSWGVLDANPASDADLWIAYALLEAGRLWNDARYAALGRTVLSLAAREEVVSLPGLGPMLLPWPQSVARGPVYRLNPSYLPLQLLRRFQQEDPSGPWAAIADNTVRMLGAVSPYGFAPDWCAWSNDHKEFVTDPDKSTVGSYDAIRVYLWAGMLHARDPSRPVLLSTLFGPRRLLEQAKAVMPEYVDTSTGAGRGNGNVGYAAALLPYLRAQDLSAPLAVQSARVQERTAVSGAPALPYYERMLILFGQGWLMGRFAFGREGQLQLQRRPSCPSARS